MIWSKPNPLTSVSSRQICKQASNSSLYLCCNILESTEASETSGRLQDNMFKRFVESKYGRILWRTFAFDKVHGFGGVGGSLAIGGFIWYTNSKRMNNIEDVAQRNSLEAKQRFENMKKTKENLDCEPVKAALSVHKKKKSVKQAGILILEVGEEEENEEDDKKGSYGGGPHGDGSYHGDQVSRGPPPAGFVRQDSC